LKEKEEVDFWLPLERHQQHNPLKTTFSGLWVMLFRTNFRSSDTLRMALLSKESGTGRAHSQMFADEKAEENRCKREA
jgi:hypothetical protein